MSDFADWKSILAHMEKYFPRPGWGIKARKSALQIVLANAWQEHDRETGFRAVKCDCPDWIRRRLAVKIKNKP